MTQPVTIAQLRAHGVRQPLTIVVVSARTIGLVMTLPVDRDMIQTEHITVEVLTCPRSIVHYRYRCSVVWGSYPVRRWTIQIT